MPDSLAGANLSRALARIQLRSEVNTRLIEYCLSSEPFLRFTATIPAGTAQRVLNLGDLANYTLALPEAPEQGAIVEWLDAQLRSLDALARRVREAIVRLNELRTALISAAVTGKIDVREEAAT